MTVWKEKEKEEKNENENEEEKEKEGKRGVGGDGGLEDWSSGG